MNKKNKLEKSQQNIIPYYLIRFYIPSRNRTDILWLLGFEPRTPDVNVGIIHLTIATMLD